MKKITTNLIAVFIFLIASATSFAQGINFTSNINQGCAPLSVTFTNTSTNVNAYRYVWNFNDGSPLLIDTVPTTVTHVFTNAGSYSVFVNVYNSAGGYEGFSYGSGNIMVNGASISGADSACANDMVNFCVNGNNISSASWNFGEPSSGANNTSTQMCALHAFASNGTYTITLNANGPCGSATVTKTIVVSGNAYPHPSFFTNSNATCPGVSVNFNSGTYTSYSWNFADPGSGANNTSTLQNPSHTYSSVGTYNTVLTVTNGCGRSGSAYQTVNVSNNPPFPNYPSFALQLNSPSCPNSIVSLNAPSGYSNYQWSFGDGSPSVTTSTNYNDHLYGGTLGNYTVSVKITSLCGNDTTLTKVLQITNSAPFAGQSFQLNANSPACPNSGVGFDAPGGFVRYVWNYGDGSSLVTSSDHNSSHTYGGTLGTYTASVKITNGCGNDTTIYKTVQIMNNVGFPNQSWFVLNTGPNPACPNDQVSLNAPGGYANYAWTFGDGSTAVSTQNNAGHRYSAGGPYTASVKITNSCGRDTTINATIVVNGTGSFPNWLQIETAASASCPNDLIEFRINQSGFQSYSWNFGDGNTATSTGEKIQHSYNAVGPYTVSCTITNGCSNTITITANVQITSNAPVNSNVTVTGVQNPSCKNDEVFFVVDHGQATYTYVWNFGDGSPVDTTVGTGTSHIYTNTGIYTVTTTVINGCGSTRVFTTTETISINAIPTLSDGNGGKIWGFPGGGDHGNGNNNTAGCANDAIVFYFMGAQPLNVWDFGDGNTGTATDHLVVYGSDGAFPVTIIKHAYAANGNYLVRLTFTNSCGNTVTDTMTIKIGGNLTVNGDLSTSPPPFTTCAAIDFIAFGGSSYNWNFGDGNVLTTTSPTVSHTFSAQGVYVVSVLVTNGCGNTATYSRSVNVNGVGGPAVTLTSATSPSCVSGSNGSATISVSSGQPPYVYSWNTPAPQAAATATGLSAGLYNATVTDVIGCSTTLAVAINDPAPIVLNITKTTTACGAANGTAAVNVTSGGSGSYTYNWSTGASTSSVSGLAAGAYSVTVTDVVKGCSSTANISISENGGATLAVNTLTGATCNGSATGSIDINVTGGTSPYIYAWSNGTSLEDPSGLAAGSYSVTVTDNSGCKATLNATVSEPTGIIVTPSVNTAPTCGNFDGKANASATGGTSPYTYLWDVNAGSQTTQIATGLPAGTYTVTVTDSKGCAMNGEISLSNSNAPNITANVSDATCFGANNGAIDITVNGGTSPYLYNWSVGPPQTNHQDLNSLTPGNYLVFVNDAKGCLSVRTYTIAQPAVLAVTVSNTGATCGNNDGTATAHTTGGNTSFTYSWTGGQTGQTAAGLAIGNYTVTVTDNKGCTAMGLTSIASVTLPVNICMVTVDTASTHNIIIWEKPAVINVDSFRVYREDVTNVYTHIGSVPYDSLSEYHDYGVNPNVTTKRYKISAIDNCGNESVKSPYHNTILFNGTNGNFNWNSYTIENGANPVNNYVLMRDDNSIGNWLPVGTTAGTQNVLTDPAYLSYPNGSWYVETLWGISCTPTRATVNTSRSNIKHATMMTGIVNAELNSVIIYPNPATDLVTVELAGSIQKATVKIMNAIGQIVYEQNVVSIGSARTIKQINTSSFAKGIYTVAIESNSAKVFKKLVVN